MQSPDYRTTGKCDTCGMTGEGTMLHSEIVDGRTMPAHFRCDECPAPQGGVPAAWVVDDLFGPDDCGSF